MTMHLRPWESGDFALLEAANTPAMKAKLGGPETAEKLADRQQRYLAANVPGDTRMFAIILDGHPVGTIGYWQIHWLDQQVYETGWEILTPFQGRGLAKQAGQLLLQTLRSEANRHFVHAFPSPENPPSNAICQSLGFTLLGTADFEYPKGNPIVVNDWQLDLQL